MPKKALTNPAWLKDAQAIKLLRLPEEADAQKLVEKLQEQVAQVITLIHRHHRYALSEEEVAGAVPAFDAMDNHPTLVQFDDTTIFEQLPQELIDKGVIFTDLFTAMKEVPELVNQYYMTFSSWCDTMIFIACIFDMHIRNMLFQQAIRMGEDFYITLHKICRIKCSFYLRAV